MRLLTSAYLSQHRHAVDLGVSGQIKLNFLVRGYANVTDCLGPKSPRSFWVYFNPKMLSMDPKELSYQEQNAIAPYFV